MTPDGRARSADIASLWLISSCNVSYRLQSRHYSVIATFRFRFFVSEKHPE